MIKLTDRQLGYLEGIIDGEGCLSLSHEAIASGNKTYKPELTITNTNLPTLQMIQSWIGGSITTSVKKTTLHPNWKTCYALRLKSEAMREILPLLKLTIKESQRLLLLELLEINASRRYGIGKWHPTFNSEKLENIYGQLRELNGNQGSKSSK
jgi:hypothetical protein